MLRYDRVGLPGNFLSVTFGSSLELTGRLDDVDARGGIPGGEFGGEARAVGQSGEIDVVHHDVGPIVRPEAGGQKIAVVEVGFRAVEEGPLIECMAHADSLRG